MGGCFGGSVQVVLGTTHGLIPAQDNPELDLHSRQPGGAEDPDCSSTPSSSPPGSSSAAGLSTPHLQKQTQRPREVKGLACHP